MLPSLHHWPLTIWPRKSPPYQLWIINPSYQLWIINPPYQHWIINPSYQHRIINPSYQLWIINPPYQHWIINPSYQHWRYIGLSPPYQHRIINPSYQHWIIRRYIALGHPGGGPRRKPWSIIFITFNKWSYKHISQKNRPL